MVLFLLKPSFSFGFKSKSIYKHGLQKYKLYSIEYILDNLRRLNYEI